MSLKARPNTRATNSVSHAVAEAMAGTIGLDLAVLAGTDHHV